MKASRLLNVVLAVALVVVSVRLAMGNAGAANRASSSGNDTADIVYQNIMTRASVRSYQEKPVEDEKIEKLLHAQVWRHRLR